MCVCVCVFRLTLKKVMIRQKLYFLDEVLSMLEGIKGQGSNVKP